MCYSAQVTQSLKQYLRLIGAVADLAQIETVLERRLTDSAVRIPRGFERNFDQPNSEQEQRIRVLLDRHRDENVTRLEQEVFTQKKRLADAQRKLKEKETKSARNDERIASNKIETALAKLASEFRPPSLPKSDAEVPDLAPRETDVRVVLPLGHRRSNDADPRRQRIALQHEQDAQ